MLKVTDSSGQFSTSDVRVFVKPPTNKPPIGKSPWGLLVLHRAIVTLLSLAANAGEDVVVSLPQTWVTLDASGSSDDIKIASYHWKQISGPSKVVFTPSNASKTNASELTRGTYELQVTVVDSDGNATSDSVLVTVNQSKSFVRNLPSRRVLAPNRPNGTF